MAGTTLLVGAPVAAAVSLHRLGSVPWLVVDWSDLAGWIGGATLEEALASILRLVALAGSYWLAGSTLLYVVALFTRVPRLVEIAGSVTLPAVRRMADGLVISGLALSSLAAPMIAGSSETGGNPRPIVMVLPPQHVDPEMPPPAAAAPTTLTLQPHGRVHPPAPMTHQTESTTQRVVVEGDNLWTLAERRLAEVLGRSPTDAETTPYWRRVVEVNTSRIESRDPDLIHPGEVILLPAVDGAG